MGSPCLKPEELSKKPKGDPFIKTENRGDCTHAIIQDIQTGLKFIASITARIYGHLIESKAFLRSILTAARPLPMGLDK
ncbi:hypothetical protein QJS10_CPA08g00720 [Acorus calamus]|uniref:Uncharacterized protein n=1 Tax=Acorus calamus TaxID=4465 RepID=A0AAV9ECJ6_ACOCL|nr:hypothetical protein QJS10_CPA08g00720 [Acorus calamus]